MTSDRPHSEAVRRLFDTVAGRFAAYDFVHRRCFEGLLERLEPMQLAPARILDLGCAAGAGSQALAKRFKRARVTGVDLSANMLQQARRSHSRFAALSRRSEVQADASRLPFATGSFDLVVANQLLPWLEDPEPAFTEIARVLRREGLLLFASLGPDSYGEIRDPGGSPLADMHDIGDALVRSGLRDPVLDVECLSVSYSSADRLRADLHGSGAVGLGGMPVDEMEGPDVPVEISLELVFGHAWGGGPPSPPGEYRLEAGAIGHLRRRHRR